MRASNIIRLIFAGLRPLLPLLLIAQAAAARAAQPPQVELPSSLQRDQIFEQLEAAPDAPPIDIVRFRLLRNEIPRWIRLEGIVDDDSFEDWAFGGELGEKRFRDQLDALLETKLQAVNRVFQLTEAQRRKVKLAGLGDIKHLLDMVGDSRQEFRRAHLDARRLPVLQKQLRQVEVRVLDGPFESGSILAKMLRKMFDTKELTSRGTH